MLKNAVIWLALSLLLASCNHKRDQIVFVRLQQWDAILEEQPRAIKDSLTTINPKELSRSNRAYHNLLKTIADDKTFVEFASDSLMNAVEHYYHHHASRHENHIRALTYLSVVRYRMGINDSTAFIPLKEAEQLYLKQKKADPSTGYMLYFFLGDMLSNTGDYTTAESHFNKALQLAKQERESIHIFDAYLALYWNEMEQENYDRGKLYLDSLNIYVGTIPDNVYYLLNAQSTYYKNIDKIEKAIDIKKEQINLIPQIKETIDIFKIYYSLSDAYLENNQLDSAMHYARLATEHITDSTYKLNYLLYENVADIAEGQHNLPLALKYRKKAFDAYEGSIDSRVDTQILELEKRYNLAEAENKALKAQRNGHIWLSIALIVILLLGIYTRNQHSIGRFKEREATEKTSRLQAEKRAEAEKALRLQAEKEQMLEQTTRQQKILEVSVQFLSEYAALQEKAREMTNRIRVKDRKLGDDYELMLKEGQNHFNNLAQQQFTEAKLQELFGIHQDLDVFSQSDRLFLIMLTSNAPNTQIAAMLNTTVHNLKTRKSYLKAKIEKNASANNNFAQLLTLFYKNTPVS